MRPLAPMIVAAALAVCLPSLALAQVAEPEPDAKRVAVLQLGSRQHGEALGWPICAEDFREASAQLKRRGVDVVIMEVYSGGGNMDAAIEIAGVLREDFQTEFHFVVLVDSALNRASVLPWMADEVFMKHQGVWGACSTFPSRVEPKEDFDRFFAGVEAVCELRGVDPTPALAIFRMFPVSLTIRDGEHRWYRDEASGDILVNRRGEMLLFDSDRAVGIRVAQGIAENPREVAALLGLDRVTWVGQDVNDLLQRKIKSRIALVDQVDRLFRIVARAIPRPGADHSEIRPPTAADCERALGLLTLIEVCLEVEPRLLRETRADPAMLSAWREQIESVLASLKVHEEQGMRDEPHRPEQP